MFAEPNMLWVLLGSGLSGLLLGTLGSFLLLRREALLGDAIAHAALPGVVVAFMLTSSRHPLILMSGALVTCLLGSWTISLLKRKSRVRSDSALAIVLVSFFALGIFLLTILQGSGAAQQSGLDRLLFGQAAGLKRSDLEVIAFLTLVTLLVVVFVFQRLKIMTFDPVFAMSIGFSVVIFEVLLSFLVGFALVLSLQLVGIILVAALLIIPAASARLLTDRFSLLIFFSASIGAASGVGGAWSSRYIENAPTGPMVVLLASAIFLIAFFFSPRHGTLPALVRRRRLRRNIAEENLLRALYRREEKTGEAMQVLEDVFGRPSFQTARSQLAIQRLVGNGSLEKSGEKVALSDRGRKKALEVTRYHRLWETFLVQETIIPPSHVHADAEEVEHFLTPELEAELIERFETVPTHDPHGQIIPAKEEE